MGWCSFEGRSVLGDGEDVAAGVVEVLDGGLDLVFALAHPEDEV
jgi:hypothetical protein